MDDGHSQVIIFLCGIIVVLVSLLIYILWKYRKAKAEQVTEEDIMTMVNEVHEQGVLESSEAEMITNIFTFDDKEAREIMIHRKSIIALDGDLTLKEAAAFVIQEGNNSRYPVYGEDMDDIIGILHMRDALVHAANHEESLMPIKDVPGLLRKACFIPEKRNINALFKEMQAEKVHMKIVVDEYGQTIGIVTMEDILEEIVGNILDEYDEEEEFITYLDDDSLMIQGMTPLRDVSEVLGISFAEADSDIYDTLNGFLISQLDRILQEGEQPIVVYDGWQFQVIRVEGMMVHSVCAKKTQEKEPHGD